MKRLQMHDWQLLFHDEEVIVLKEGGYIQMSSELLDALTVLEREKGISEMLLIEAIEAALVSAYRRNFNQAQNVRIDLNLASRNDASFC